MSKEDLIRRCNEVRDELEPSGNTAQRVGQLLADIVEELDGAQSEPLTIKMDGDTVAVYDGTEAEELNITPEIINARRHAEAGSFITNGLSCHYFAGTEIPNYGSSAGKYVPLIRMESRNMDKMDVVFTIGSREWGPRVNYYGKYRFTGRSNQFTLDCLEFYNASTDEERGLFDFDDIVFTVGGFMPSVVTIYKKIRVDNRSDEYFYVNIEGENASGYATYKFYTTYLNPRSREIRVTDVYTLNSFTKAQDRRPSLVQSVDDEEFIALSQRIKNTYNIKRISECTLDENGIYVALETDEMLIVDSTTGANNASLLGIKLSHGIVSPYGQDCVIQLTVCNISGATTTVYYEYDSGGSVQQSSKTNSTGQKDTFVCIQGNWVREY